MDKYEYKTISFESTGFFGGKLDVDSFNATLNYYGKDGWELVSTFTTNEGYGSTKKVIAVFKKVLL